ncbi:MAG: hypothetical protein AAF682_22385 [Planctomycetota bacterium]
MRLRAPFAALLLLASLTSATPLAAQDTLVIDLKPGGGFPGSGFVWGEAIAFGDRLLFGGDDGGGVDLWITDGTAAGTEQVTDIFPDGDSFPRELTPLGGGDEIVFGARDADGFGLWKTDGTGAGTVKLSPAGESHFYTDLVAYGGEVYFLESAGFPFNVLWKTDGTVAGTVALTSTFPPVASAGPSEDPDRVFVEYKGELFFVVFYVGAAGNYELWKTDGTVAGTGEVYDFASISAIPDQLTVAGDTLYFACTTAAFGRELWKTDGTTAGTGIAVDVAPGPSSSNPGPLAALDNGLLLFGDFQGLFGPEEQLWSTDGTPAGTQLLHSSGAPVLALGGVGPKAYFVASSSLYETDGTPAGTQLVGGLFGYHVDNPTPTGVGSGDELVFRAQDWTDQEGIELWFTDGQQVAPVADVHPGSDDSHPSTFRRAGGRVYFAADDGVTGTELHSVALAELGGWVGEGFGGGCGVGAPVLALGGEATVGSAVTVELSGAPALAPAALYFSTEHASVDLGGGCAQYLASPLLLSLHGTDGAGAASVPAALPPDASLAGLALFLQDAILAPGGPLLGLAELSGGLEVVIGP